MARIDELDRQRAVAVVDNVLRVEGPRADDCHRLAGGQVGVDLCVSRVLLEVGQTVLSVGDVPASEIAAASQLHREPRYVAGVFGDLTPFARTELPRGGRCR